MEKVSKISQDKSYDVLILGGGPAGLTAAIYAGRYNLKTLVVAGNFGGAIALAGEVENWPGRIGSGREIMDDFKSQAEKFGAEFLEASFEKVEKVGDEFVLHYEEGVVKGRSLIVCLGTEHRQLNIPGEKEFLGKGVSYCTTCDANFFKGKKVAVIGGANSAATAAMYLANICEKVTVVYHKKEMRCEPILLERIKAAKNIEIIYESNAVEVLGSSPIRDNPAGPGVVKGLKIVTDDKVESVLDVSGVFVEAGATPATEVLKDLGLTMEKNYIVTGKDCKTNIEGVFAAGDVTNSAMRQMVTAAAEGSVAAKGVHEYILTRDDRG
jgi:thioredoxin reductase (NADPH)